MANGKDVAEKLGISPERLRYKLASHCCESGIELPNEIVFPKINNFMFLAIIYRLQPSCSPCLAA